MVIRVLESFCPRCAGPIVALGALLGGCVEAPPPEGSRSDALLSAAPIWSLAGTSLSEQMGERSNPAGDVNADGYGDVLIGNSATMFLHLGGPGGLATNAAWTTWPIQAGDYRWTQGVGDVNGDGYDDVLALDTNWDSALYVNAGRAQLYYGGAGGLAASPSWTWSPEEADHYLAYPSGSAGGGDVNGDGFADLLLGCGLCDGVAPDEGGLELFLGSPTGPGSTPDASWRSGDPSGEGGVQARIVGDVNGDGFDDLAVGRWYDDTAFVDAGLVHVFHGGTGALLIAPDWTTYGSMESDLLGGDLGGNGDVNGDGFGDLVIAEIDWSNGLGRGQVYLGSASGLGGAPVVTVTSGPNSGANMHHATMGDLDGDGLADAIFGSQGRDTTAGWGWVFVSRGVLGGVPAPAWGMGPPVPYGGNELFGSQISPSPDANGDGRAELTIGARWSNVNGYRSGIVYQFGPDGTTPSPVPAWLGYGGQPGVALGGARSGMGDIDGDGLDDLLLGLPGWTGPSGAGEGRIYLVEGADGGALGSPIWVALGGQAGAELGAQVVTGDFDGDGQADVAAGAPGWDGVATDEGRALVWYGAGSLPGAPDLVVQEGRAGGRQGAALLAADLDGDGYDDLVTGSPGATVVVASEGVVDIYFGGPAGLSGVSTWTWATGAAAAGISALAAGQLDGDGVADLVVGAPGFSNGEAGEGVVWVFGSSGGAPSAAPVLVIEGSEAGAASGASVATADLDIDGDDEVIIGEPGRSGGGRVLIVPGSPIGPEVSGAASFMGTSGGFGARVAAGDVDGDGVPDAVVTADTGHTGQVLLGQAGALPGGVDWIQGIDAPLFDGFLDVVVGDVDGDGVDDVLFGGDLATNTVSGEGAYALHLGGLGAAGGAHVHPLRVRALQPGAATAISPGGRSLATDAFDVVVDAWTSRGSGRAKLQVEVKPWGTPFDGAGLIETATWTAIPAGGGEFTVPVTGLTVDTAYHWRARLAFDPAQAPLLRQTRWVAPDPAHPLGVHLRTDADTDGDGDPDTSDCDDTDPLVFTGAPELCNGVDDACVGSISTDEIDADADGYFPCAGDCDDGDAALNPGALEGCDLLDTNCDGVVDPDEADADSDGVAVCAGDCDDGAPTVFPAAPELCGNSVDDDCDGAIDGLDPDNDADADGSTLCDATPDCDDADPLIGAGFEEFCDGVDSDCDGSLLDEFPDQDADGVADCTDPDVDGDGSPNGLDCDPSVATVYPGAPEICDGVDSDCNGTVPDEELDGDNDGYASCEGDCRDADGAINPGATELCDGVDQDCDGAADDGLPLVEWFADADGDGFGDAAAPYQGNPHCGPDGAWVEDATDCDDLRAGVNPNAVEVADNGVDDDCDGEALGIDATRAPAPGIGCSQGGAGPTAALLLVPGLLGFARRRARR